MKKAEQDFLEHSRVRVTKLKTINTKSTGMTEGETFEADLATPPQEHGYFKVINTTRENRRGQNFSCSEITKMEYTETGVEITTKNSIYLLEPIQS